MAHNKCLKYSLFWAATATAPISTCTLDATITSVDDGDITTPVVTPCTEGYGLLYNWYAVSDIRNITAFGYSVMTISDWQNLALYVDPGLTNYITGNTAGTKLKESGIVYWINNNGTNNYQFNARGSGQRDSGGVFTVLKSSGVIWTSEGNIYGGKSIGIYDTNAYINCSGLSDVNKKYAFAIRIKKDSTTLSNGQSGTYIGNDEQMYRTICINGVEYLADNLRETKFRNGDVIPYYGIDNSSNFTNAEWGALTTAGVCAYNNDVSNVGCDFSFEPTVIVVPEPEENCDIFVPQGFSPSNQDGINDYFRVQNLDCYPTHKMSIYDRNGNLLYTRTNNYNTEPWDGKVGGIVVSGVTRTWILEINGAIHSTGSVYVI